MAEKESKSVASVELTLTKNCKHVYRFDTKEEGAAVTNIYVDKACFEGTPKKIRIKIYEA